MSTLVDVMARNAALLRLPPRVAIFYSRARRLAARSGDDWSLQSATKPESLRELLRVARGQRRVAEIGTGTAWTTAALALADRRRRISSFDPVVRPERDRYLELAAAARDRTIETFRVWRPAVTGLVAFHDYGNPAYPGVSEAIAALRLEGRVIRDLFVWTP